MGSEMCIRDRAFSSAGLEHLPYKQRVGGSNPSTPTGVFPRGPSGLRGFFVFIPLCHSVLRMKYVRGLYLFCEPTLFIKIFPNTYLFK